MTKNYHINFYGGEPLLSFNLIKETIAFLKNKNKELKKKVNYTITTNGSLLTEEILQFLSEYKFSVELSFDGLSQDILRKKDSFKEIAKKIGELLNHKNIGLEVNSVFTPDSVGHLSESVKIIRDLGVPNIRVSFSTIKHWNRVTLLRLEKETAKLRKIVIDHYRKEGNIPVVNFRDLHKKGVFYCTAGKDRLALATDGEIWGCYLFSDYYERTVDKDRKYAKGVRAKREEKGRTELRSRDYKRFSFGSLENFKRNYRTSYPRIMRNYGELSMDNFSTPKMKCFLCDKLENCGACPINAAFSGVRLGEIPSHICEIQKINIREKEKFKKEINL
ncbi:MAG: hypothetical protein JSV96_05270 [Candidatus Aminicenantes bacterium]|nr:MAG: hypothetical protein JSV96_05270 [Candidatus Aminicenantes bacterium]